MTADIDAPLWTAKEIACLAEGETNGDWFAEALVTKADGIIAGDVFVACEQPVSADQGHDAVVAALTAGAEGAVVSRVPKGLRPEDERLIVVDNTDSALRRLAIAARERMPGTLVAIAGQVGKTGVKEATTRAVGRLEPVHACNHRQLDAHGCLVELANIPRTARCAIIEVDLADAATVALLAEVIRPDVAAITTMPVSAGGDHVNESYFRLVSAIAEDGALVINAACPHAGQVADVAAGRDLRVLTAALDDKTANIHPVRTSFQADCTCMTVMVEDSLLTFKASLPGRHWAANSLVVLGIVAALGSDLGMAGLALAAMRPLPGRGAVRRVHLADGVLTVVDHSADSDPLSLRACLDVIARIPSEPAGQRIAVLADMAGYGDSLDALHGDLAADLAGARLSKAYVSGPAMIAVARTAGVPTETFEDTNELANKLARNAGAGDVVLVKGAGGSGVGRVVTRLMMRDLGRPEQAGRAFAPLAAE